MNYKKNNNAECYVKKTRPIDFLGHRPKVKAKNRHKLRGEVPLFRGPCAKYRPSNPENFPDVH